MVEMTDKEIQQNPAFRLGMMMGAMEAIQRRLNGPADGKIRDIRSIVERALQSEQDAARG